MKNLLGCSVKDLENLALNYGSKSELVDAFNKIKKSKKKNSISQIERLMVADAQTSGGLLISLPKDNVKNFLEYYNSKSTIPAFQIGSVNARKKSLINIS